MPGGRRLVGVIEDDHRQRGRTFLGGLVGGLLGDVAGGLVGGRGAAEDAGEVDGFFDDRAWRRCRVGEGEIGQHDDPGVVRGCGHIGGDGVPGRCGRRRVGVGPAAGERTGETVLADRILDEPPRQARQQNGDREGDDGPDPGGVGADGQRNEGHDRHVPQVDPVRPLADPAQRRQAQQRRDQGVRGDRRGQDAEGGDGEQGQPPGVEAHRVVVRGEDEVHDGADAGQAEDVEPAALRVVHLALARGPPEGEGGAEQETARAGVGALVGAGVVEGGGGEGVEQPERAEREGHDHHRHHRAPLEHQEHQRQQQRPDEVELLLDRQ